MSCGELYSMKVESINRAMKAGNVIQFFCGFTSLIVGVGVLYKVWNPKKKLSFINIVIAFGLMQAVCNLVCAISWNLHDFEDMSNKQWHTILLFCYFVWSLSAVSDFIIAFMYLKSIVGVSHPEKLSLVKQIETGTFVFVLVCFSTVQFVIIILIEVYFSN